MGSNQQITENVYRKQEKSQMQVQVTINPDYRRCRNGSHRHFFMVASVASGARACAE